MYNEWRLKKRKIQVFDTGKSESRLHDGHEGIIVDLVEKINQSNRPVIIGGWGVHLASGENLFRRLVEKTEIPTVLTWGGCDLLESYQKNNVGTFGTHGKRAANLAVQNADLIISIGSRLDTKATGSPPNTFSRESYKVVVDIDNYELNKFDKFDLKIDSKINCDAKVF